MKRKLFLLLCAQLTMIGVQQVKADTSLLSTDAGWQKITALPATVTDYYFTIVDNSSDLMLTLSRANKQDAAYNSLYYKKSANSLVDKSMLFSLEAHGGSYVMTNVEYNEYFLQTEWNAAHYYRTHDNGGGNKDWGKISFTYRQDGYWTIQNAQIPVDNGNYLGVWNDGQAAANGQELALNKSDANKGTYQIYAIAKTDAQAYWDLVAAGTGASQANPMDMTALIKNPNARFWHSSKPYGWTTTGTQNINNGVGYDNFPGIFEYSNWGAGSWTGSLKQTISVPNGKYVLKAAFMASSAVTVYLTANSDKSENLAPIGDNGGNINEDGTETEMGQGQRGWKYLTLETVVTNGSLELGTYASSNASHNWVNADNFTLTYYGEDLSIYVKAYHDARDAANAVNQSTPMNADVLSALQTAITTYGTGVDETNKDALLTATSALNAAASAATNSIAAYAAANAAITKAEAMETANNFVTSDAATTFAEAIAAIKTPYTNGTLSDADANTAGTDLGVVAVGWHAAATNTPASHYLGSTWPSEITINDWSIEGETDGSNYLVPFFQNWTNDGNSLSATTMTGTLTGLSVGTYKVSAWVRVRAKNGTIASDATGITMDVNGGTPVDVTEGTQVGTTQFQMKEYEATGYVLDDGVLTVNFNIAMSNNISWLSYQNISYTRTGDVPAADADDYAALANAISAVSGYVAGFEDGEYAPYNNVEAFAALAVAQAINPSATNLKTVVQAATEALNNATWTANVGEQNAVYDGNFAIQTEHTTGPTALAGWNNPEGIRQLIKNTETYPGLTSASAQAAVFAWGGTTMKYGETDGYTIPLKGHAIYELSFKTCGWADGDMGYVNVDVKNASDEGLQTVSTVVATKRITEENPWDEFKILFVTGEAGNYKLGMWTSKHTTFTDIVLKKAASQTLTFDDDAAMPAFAPGTYPRVRVNRTLNAGENVWNTLVLPFDYTNAEWAVRELTSSTEENLSLSVVDGGAMTAGKPYLVRPNEAVTSIEAVSVAVITTPTAVVTEKYNFIPVFAPTTITGDGTNYFVATGTNKLYCAKANINTNGYRAYFHYTGTNSGARSVFLNFDETDPTAINAIETAEAESGDLKDGKYIIDNKVVIVKNGVKYSANGQKLN